VLPPVVDTTPLRFVWDARPAPIADSARAGRSGGDGNEDEALELGDAEQEDGDDEAEREETAALRECVHAWARYNPTLTLPCVQLGCEERRTWVHRAVGGR
jgi:hypothetical protein